MKSILKSREMLLLVLGLILTGAALIGASLARNLPNFSGVYYVSNAEKSSLIAQEEAVNPKLNINSAASEELEERDGIGEIIAQNIVFRIVAFWVFHNGIFQCFFPFSF